ncbi:Ig-like domain-containing protein [Aeromicrobium sp. IC_218]|uniref:Ig-like domain-containing protein n=1 Tax=Aeromicrobium sp. IC_218 TaxID=2545468 RepID=UPI0013F42C07|nr:Ig-like domain-containing protein [Aeromicrobium sp. IC_218]
MTARSRLAALSIATALAAGVLAATPATAQQRSYTNPMATPDRTDAGIVSVGVDATPTTVSVRLRTENLPGDFRVSAYLTQHRYADHGGLLILDAGVEGGVLRGTSGTSVANVFQGGSTELPAGTVRYARQGADVVLSVDTRHLTWSGPLHAGGNLQSMVGGGMAAVSYDPGTDDAPTFFGPITTAADATTTTLGRSAARQVYGQARPTVVTAKVPAAVAGSVVFRDGATPLGTVKPAGGVARLSLPRTLRAGMHTVTATFVPTDRVRYSTSTASTSLSVTAQATRTTVRLSSGRQTYRGEPVRVTVTVSGRPTGTVTVLDGRRRLKTVRVKDGRATYTLPRTLAAGKHRIKATFRPATAGTFRASTSASRTLTVRR